MTICMALMLTSCGKKSPIDKDGVYSDGYISITLPAEHFIAVDMSEEMGNHYHKYLVFKGARDFTGSNIIYMSFKVTGNSLETFDAELKTIERSMRAQYASAGKQFEGVSFTKLDTEGCMGYVYEFIVTSGETVIHHIMYSAVRTKKREAVTVFFNCTDEGLLEEYRASCETITIG